MKTGYLIVGSLVAHLGGFALISRKAHEIEQKQTLIQVVEQEKKKEEEKKAEPPKPIEAPAEVLQPAKATAPSPEPAPSEPAVNDAPSSAMQAMPDYGLKLGSAGSSGGVGEGGNGTGTGGGGGGGTGDAGAPGPARPVEKTLAKPAPAGAAPDLAAEIAAWKPKPTARVKPVYPDEARSSEIEGTVTVEAIVDCSGKVKSASLVKGLGHGLDEAALTAVKKTDFEPAPRCVAGFQKPMKINYAFRLGD